jgi:hypothetical protein
MKYVFKPKGIPQIRQSTYALFETTRLQQTDHQRNSHNEDIRLHTKLEK